MSELKQWTVRQVPRRAVRDFLETWHYSKSINGVKSSYCYALYNTEGEMMGALLFGNLAMHNQWKRFSSKGKDDVIELRRLACIDDTPKNTESYFIGKSIRLLSTVWGGSVIISYADKEFGHVGTIYKASNFEQLEDIPGARVVVHNGRSYHDKALRCKYKGKLKPYSQRLVDALASGEAFYKRTAGKYTYIYDISKRRKRPFVPAQRPLL